MNYVDTIHNPFFIRCITRMHDTSWETLLRDILKYIIRNELERTNRKMKTMEERIKLLESVVYSKRKERSKPTIIINNHLLDLENESDSLVHQS